MHQKDAVKGASAPPQSRRDKHLRNNVARDTQITGRDVAVGEGAERPVLGGYTASMPNCRLAGADAGEAMYSSSARPNSGRLQPGDTPPENKVMV